MPLVGTNLKAAMKARIQAGLARNFSNVSNTEGYGGISAQQWELIADALSDVALDIVQQIQTEAEVLPGIPVATSSGAGATSAPGRIS